MVLSFLKIILLNFNIMMKKTKTKALKGIIQIDNDFQEEYIFDKAQISKKIFHKDKSEIQALFHFNY